MMLQLKALLRSRSVAVATLLLMEKVLQFTAVGEFSVTCRAHNDGPGSDQLAWGLRGANGVRRVQLGI
jgi:hypothetical protein